MLYYFDETADQGFVDKTSTLDEYGIIGGIAIPNWQKDNFETKFGKILSKLTGKGYKKLHCTEIFKDDNNNDLKNEMYDILNNIDEYLIIYEGIYSIGVKQHEELSKETIEKLAPKQPDHIKISKSKKRTRLYSTLLEAIICKLEECAKIEGEEEVYLISDMVDQKVQKESSESLVRLKSKSSFIKSKSFNTKTGHKTEKTHKLTIKSEIGCVERVKEISYESEVTPLLFAADFLCFELLRHFRRKMKISRPIKFHAEETIEGFPLKNKVAFIGDNYFSDLVFAPEINV